ncbi:uncharacterized protein LY79DRAFT_76363 [Colletotrichum navitas]|uniref:Uncharacterized protein n=1 Tax=Colletotrichum navitas TaxID=681940 RepID=A0AAD8Q696_9PEZI|nr:uncharacterized protein LY79DRAFT_76363 [Colletotrichum navitas]KAK1596051.1 hypothetical protein LY79DRAFT_76363 [Colletotrichum navitas]
MHGEAIKASGPSLSPTRGEEEPAKRTRACPAAIKVTTHRLSPLGRHRPLTARQTYPRFSPPKPEGEGGGRESPPSPFVTLPELLPTPNPFPGRTRKKGGSTAHSFFSSSLSRLYFVPTLLVAKKRGNGWLSEKGSQEGGGGGGGGRSSSTNPLPRKPRPLGSSACSETRPPPPVLLRPSQTHN